MKQIIHLTLFATAILAITSCSSTYSTPFSHKNPNAIYQPGVPGGVVVETETINATLTDIDVNTRQVTLLVPSGKTTTITCGPEVISFDQLKVGDQLQVTLTAKLAAAMADPNTPMSDGVAQAVALAPQGTNPAGLVAETEQVTAQVTGIDLTRHQVTLQFPNGTVRTITARPDVDLTQRKIGDEVVIRATVVATAILKAKP
jgi:hypothetical protein